MKDLSEDERKVAKAARSYIEEHKEQLVEKLITGKNPLRLSFSTICMAGSPGAGKTEFSKHYIPSTLDRNDVKLVRKLKMLGVDIESVDALLVRIDADEIRDFLPDDLYHKTDIASGVRGNAHVVQQAVNYGLNVLRRYCLRNDVSFIHDGTFSNYDTMRNLIRASLDRGRDVQIFYIYLDPVTAWHFTKAREGIEGRNIRKEDFICQFFKSRENVDRAKADFGSDIRVHCVIKDAKNEPIFIEQNVPSVDKYLQSKYDKGLIKSYSEEGLRRELD
jgi:UDP-N-acetylglucosamine kinase